MFLAKSFFFIRTPLGIKKKSIYSFIGLILIKVDLKMIPRELLGLFDITRAQIFFVYKLTEVVIIG